MLDISQEISSHAAMIIMPAITKTKMDGVFYSNICLGSGSVSSAVKYIKRLVRMAHDMKNTQMVF